MNDWAMKAARQIVEVECNHRSAARVERIAAVLRQYARPALALVYNAKREHQHCDDAWYCCGKCEHPDHDGADGLSNHRERRAGECNCGADAWNEKVERTCEALGITDDTEAPIG